MTGLARAPELDGASETAQLEELLFAERIRLLEGRFWPAQVTVLVNAAVIAAVFWRLAPTAIVLGWAGAIAVLVAARSVVTAAHGRRPEPSPRDARAWAHRYVVGAALNGAVWGASALVFGGRGSPSHELLLAFVLGGMCAGAAAANASYAPGFVAFTAPALAPMIVRFASARDPVHLAMAFMLVVFGLAVSWLSRGTSRAVEDAIRLRLHNERLVVRLTAAQDGLAALNASLERRVAERTLELEGLLRKGAASEAKLARYRALLDASGDAVLIVRAEDLTVVDANEGACRLLSCDPATLVGAELGALGLAPALTGAAARTLAATLEPGVARRFEDARAEDGGRVRALEFSLALRDLDGARYLLVAARDLSERKELEARLVQAGLLARIGSLAAGVAHEINNPLATISANLQYLRPRLQAGPVPPDDLEELREVVDDSLLAAARARDTVKDLSALAPRGRPEWGLVDVNALLKTCVGVSQAAARGRATLEHDLVDVPPVRADRERLAQVFLGLLAHAAEAIPEGARGRVTVRSRFDPADGAVRVDVEDTGRGIAPEHLGRVFDPFDATKPFGQGTGLGLAICHAIVTGLGGRIAVQSREGEGSTFTVSLPAAAAGEDQAAT